MLNTWYLNSCDNLELDFFSTATVFKDCFFWRGDSIRQFRQQAAQIICIWAQQSTTHLNLKIFQGFSNKILMDVKRLFFYLDVRFWSTHYSYMLYYPQNKWRWIFYLHHYLRNRWSLFVQSFDFSIDLSERRKKNKTKLACSDRMFNNNWQSSTLIRIKKGNIFKSIVFSSN